MVRVTSHQRQLSAADLHLLRLQALLPLHPTHLDTWFCPLFLPVAVHAGATVAPDAYELTPRSLTLKAPPAGPFSLRVVTAIKPQDNSLLEGLYKSGGNYCTQVRRNCCRAAVSMGGGVDLHHVLGVVCCRMVWCGVARSNQGPHCGSLLFLHNLIGCAVDRTIVPTAAPPLRLP